MDVCGTIPDVDMSSHTATVVDDEGIMLVFGGSSLKYKVYSLELTSMKWSCIDKVEYNRSGGSADLIAGSIYLFGG